MARPRSEDKRNALLSAAIKIFAKNGLSASTASVTKEAGLAEGTLFVYFKGKEELINTLYVEIKCDLARAMLAGYPTTASIHDRIKHIWSHYVDWGVKHPKQLALMHKLKVYEHLTDESRDTANAKFCELRSLTTQAISEGIFRNISEDFVIAMLSAQAETTMQFMREEREKATFYREKGFELFWNGLSHSE
jgi:AcrR family transcriptional regulator